MWCIICTSSTVLIFLSFFLSVTAMKKLKTAYNNGLRGLPNLPKYNSASEMFVNLNIPSFGELLRKFVFSFKSAIMNSDNLLYSEWYCMVCYTVI